MEKYVKIPLKEYLELQHDSLYLNYLNTCGVDNWEPGISFNEFLKENDYPILKESDVPELIINENEQCLKLIWIDNPGELYSTGKIKDFEIFSIDWFKTIENTYRLWCSEELIFVSETLETCKLKAKELLYGN